VAERICYKLAADSAPQIATRPAPPPSFRTYNRTTTADEAAAEEQFLESTPWANPRHPSHQEARFGPAPSRVPSYQTPAGQRRVIDLTAPNGSASTIDANSNPPSANAPTTNVRIGDSESPVLQMKGNPPGQSAYSDTPGPYSRNFGALAKESYPMLSSPATQPVDTLPQDTGQRWGGNSSRSLNTGPPTAAPAPPGSGRLGTISVGNGLFSR
jgi:hypothetical protein